MTDLHVQREGQVPTAARVVRAGPERRDALAAVMAAAFDQDPISRWLFPDAGSRQALQRRLFAHVLDAVFPVGEVYTLEWGTGDAGTGVTMWLPVDPEEDADGGGAGPGDAEPAVDDALRGVLGEHADRFAVLSALMGDAHPAHEPHLYLPFVGVAPGHQGHGVGTRLLGDRLAALDAAGTPSYLEASCPRNQRLYERLGFRPIGTPIALPDGPELVPMWRPAGAGQG